MNLYVYPTTQAAQLAFDEQVKKLGGNAVVLANSVTLDIKFITGSLYHGQFRCANATTNMDQFRGLELSCLYVDGECIPKVRDWFAQANLVR